MYCSGCGLALMPGQGVCPQCGRPAAPAIPAVPGMEFQLQNYAGKVKALSVVWFIYAGFYLLHGVAGLTFAKRFLFGGFGPWSHGPWAHGPLPPQFFAGVLGFTWMILLLKTGLAILAAWGLLDHQQWGRIVAIVAGFVFLVNVPFGTALGIWTLVMLMGYRNATLYDQL